MRELSKLTLFDTMLGEAGLVTTETLVNAAGNHDYRRVEVAALYGVAIAYDGGHMDWPAVNQAILARWSKSGLKTIKGWAWGGVKHAGVGYGTEARA